MTDASSHPPGWYHAEGDPPGSQRYWDGEQWVGDPRPVGDAPPGGPPAERDAVPELGRVLATPGHRILARLIDVVIAVAVALGLLALFGADSVEDGSVSTGYFVIAALFTVLYEVGMVATKGATLGKMAVGVTVVTVEGTSPPGVGPAFRRWVPSVVGYIPLIGALAGLVVIALSLVWIFTDRRRRSVYDRVGGTYVVRAR